MDQNTPRETSSKEPPTKPLKPARVALNVLALCFALSVLGRGYAIATERDGRAVRDASALAPGDTVSVRVARGRFGARVTDVEPDGGESA